MDELPRHHKARESNEEMACMHNTHDVRHKGEKKDRICFGIIRIKTVVVIVHGWGLFSMHSF